MPPPPLPPAFHVPLLAARLRDLETQVRFAASTWQTEPHESAGLALFARELASLRASAVLLEALVAETPLPTEAELVAVLERVQRGGL